MSIGRPPKILFCLIIFRSRVSSWFALDGCILTQLRVAVKRHYCKVTIFEWILLYCTVTKCLSLWHIAKLRKWSRRATVFAV
nr:MAG TPA: hypothetical protein [Caudoviricetes sp.]